MIASDLRQAIELLPDEIYTYGSPMAGHATKYAAEALMARVWLFYTGRYDQESLPEVTKAEVIGWIDDCVENSGLTWFPISVICGLTRIATPMTTIRICVTTTLLTTS